jgi:DNA polymerase I
MWIFDSYFKGSVELWSRERGLERISIAYTSSFYMHLKDPHAHWEMIQALENRFRVEECSFNSIFGTFEGHRIYASRKVAGEDRDTDSICCRALQRGRQA